VPGSQNAAFEQGSKGIIPLVLDNPLGLKALVIYDVSHWLTSQKTLFMTSAIG
jgi:hypothetical protein